MFSRVYPSCVASWSARITSSREIIPTNWRSGPITGKLRLLVRPATALTTAMAEHQQYNRPIFRHAVSLVGPPKSDCPRSEKKRFESLYPILGSIRPHGLASTVSPRLPFKTICPSHCRAIGNFAKPPALNICRPRLRNGACLAKVSEDCKDAFDLTGFSNVVDIDRPLFLLCRGLLRL